ncbi:phosphatidate cytidylyltransferase [Paracoccus jiaweipingae]|uniref:phosphatidate cytidylyltransferase n=1 Tax=unclassified Paracoccus (in: a-proteobacteria) TaxID=2688777 RepID=UPI00379A3D8B
MAGTAQRWSDLSARLVSGVVLAVAGVAMIVAAGMWLRVGVSVLCGVMVWELARLTAWRHAEFHAPRRPELLGLIAGVTLFAMLSMPGDWPALLVVVPVLFGWRGTHINERAPWVFFTIAILSAGYAVVVIREVMGLPTAAWVAGTVVLTDVLGYFAGRTFGGPKFWPSLSPKKTWSGTVAGWVGAFVLALVVVLIGWGDLRLLILGPLLSFAGQMGDIIESALKRRVGVKDSSAILPGHGGLMDRFDAMCAAFLLLMMLGIVMDLPVVGAL